MITSIQKTVNALFHVNTIVAKAALTTMIRATRSAKATSNSTIPNYPRYKRASFQFQKYQSDHLSKRQSLPF